MKRRSIAQVVSSCLLGGVFACLLLPAPKAEAALAANFSLPYHTNNAVKLKLHDFAGKVILVEFFDPT